MNRDACRCPSCRRRDEAEFWLIVDHLLPPGHSTPAMGAEVWDPYVQDSLDLAMRYVTAAYPDAYPDDPLDPDPYDPALD